MSTRTVSFGNLSLEVEDIYKVRLVCRPEVPLCGSPPNNYFCRAVLTKGQQTEDFLLEGCRDYDKILDRW